MIRRSSDFDNVCKPTGQKQYVLRLAIDFEDAAQMLLDFEEDD